jgi:hypothetical protein
MAYVYTSELGRVASLGLPSGAAWMETTFGATAARIAVVYLGVNFAIVIAIVILAALS